MPRHTSRNRLWRLVQTLADAVDGLVEGLIEAVAPPPRRDPIPVRVREPRR